MSKGPLKALRIGDMVPPISMRKDALPEGAVYADQGCDIQPSCLACPLPQCRFDMVAGKRSIRASNRQAAIQRLLRTEGLTIDQVAERLGVTRRTVFRALEGARV